MIYEAEEYTWTAFRNIYGNINLCSSMGERVDRTGSMPKRGGWSRGRYRVVNRCRCSSYLQRIDDARVAECITLKYWDREAPALKCYTRCNHEANWKVWNFCFPYIASASIDMLIIWKTALIFWPFYIIIFCSNTIRNIKRHQLLNYIDRPTRTFISLACNGRTN